jgi:nitrite reductase (NO-forming)
MMFTRSVAVLLAGAIALAGWAASGHAAPTKPAATRPAPRATATPKPAATAAAALSGRIAVTAREFQYEPNQFTVKAGEVTFVVKNAGAIDHDFVVEDAKNKELTMVHPFPAGKTMEVKVKLVPGTYTAFCSIPGHREAGMSAKLQVVP